MNYIEFTVLKAFTSEFKLRTNPVKAFNGTVCEAHVNNISSNLVACVADALNLLYRASAN